MGPAPRPALVACALLAVAACAGRARTPPAPPPPRAAPPEAGRALPGGAPAAGTGPERVLPVPRTPGAVAPPSDRRVELPAVPPPPDPLAPPGNPGAPATSTADCVDRELARRGLNAYGDPPGTVYPVAPPAPASARIAHVLAHHPELRTTCEVPQGR